MSSALIRLLRSDADRRLGGAFDKVWALLRWPVAALTMMTMVAFIYYFLPNVKQKWRFITPGSVVAVLAWIAASLGFRLYVSHFGSYAKTYGALATVGFQPEVWKKWD